MEWDRKFESGETEKAATMANNQRSGGLKGKGPQRPPSYCGGCFSTASKGVVMGVSSRTEGPGIPHKQEGQKKSGYMGGAEILCGDHLSENLLSSYCMCGVGWVPLLPCEGLPF